MRWMVDVLAVVVALLTSPWWLWRLARSGKLRTDWAGRLGFGPPLARTTNARLLLHAVSVGEVDAVRRGLVTELAGGDAPIDLVIASTTNTGFARARELFGDEHSVVRYPFDFSFAVGRFLRRVRPDAVALVELEVWPNFVAACTRRSIPVAVVNGRLTERSAGRYRRIRALMRRAFSALAHVGVQTDAYADRFRALGVDEARIDVTGTMKWDSVPITDDVAGAGALAEAMGIDRSRPLVVAGSTAPEEHALLHRIVPEGVQLLCAPRRPEWFDQAARDLPGCTRRSNGASGGATDRFLLDTIGELRQAYALAAVVVIGRSFGERHGSDMMEPIALGRATIVGPAVSDFQATVDALLAGEGIVQITADELPATVELLLASRDRREQLARRGRAVIERERGATKRTAEHLRRLLARPTQKTRRPGG